MWMKQHEASLTNLTIPSPQIWVSRWSRTHFPKRKITFKRRQHCKVPLNFKLNFKGFFLYFAMIRQPKAPHSVRKSLRVSDMKNKIVTVFHSFGKAHHVKGKYLWSRMDVNGRTVLWRLQTDSHFTQHGRGDNQFP